jgi:hypothetical protein
VSAEPLTGSEETSAPRSRLPVILFATLVGLAVLVGAWLLWLAPGGDGAGAAAAIDDLAVAADDEPARPAAADVDGTLEPLPVVTHDIYLARDPFEPVVEEEAAASDSGDGTSEGATPASVTADGLPVVEAPDPVPGTEPQPGDPLPVAGDPLPGEGEPLPDAGGFVPPPDGTSSGTCTGQEELVCDGRVVTLDSVTMRNGERVATIQVGTDVYEVAQGEVFASTFRVVEFTETGVRLQYGELIYELTAAHRSLK